MQHLYILTKIIFYRKIQKLWFCWIYNILSSYAFSLQTFSMTLAMNNEHTSTYSMRGKKEGSHGCKRAAVEFCTAKMFLKRQ
jgi:hypothetical protein